jgi:hypothetical protein
MIRNRHTDPYVKLNQHIERLEAENAKLREALKTIARIDKAPMDLALFHQRWQTPYQIARVALGKPPSEKGESE